MEEASEEHSAPFEGKEMSDEPSSPVAVPKKLEGDALHSALRSSVAKKYDISPHEVSGPSFKQQSSAFLVNRPSPVPLFT
mmetsp:Transcript_15160/g.23402  ORF Transcript_15160/g.23402 Transcript_15160/m.23402 type:complete len:80 (+) Transcript_15160:364-603(+)